MLIQCFLSPTVQFVDVNVLFQWRKNTLFPRPNNNHRTNRYTPTAGLNLFHCWTKIRSLSGMSIQGIIFCISKFIIDIIQNIIDNKGRYNIIQQLKVPVKIYLLWYINDNCTQLKNFWMNMNLNAIWWDELLHVGVWSVNIKWIPRISVQNPCGAGSAQ